MFKKITTTLLVATLAAVFAATLLNTSQASAAINRDSIISDTLYRNSETMTQGQIQKFLKDRGSYLANYKDKGPNETKKEKASYLIWHAADIWGINPQVIIATLQKEQSLITMQNPGSGRLNAAMGYSCPDSGGCDPKYKGFANQVNGATFQLRNNYEALKGSKNFKDVDGDTHTVKSFNCDSADTYYNKALRPGNTVTFYRNKGIKGTKDAVVKIANNSTASLYCYTPHSGPYDRTGYSGSDNFITYFTSWFGDPNIEVVDAIKAYHESNGGYLGKFGKPKSNQQSFGDDSGVYQQFEKGVIYSLNNEETWGVRGAIKTKYSKVGADSGVLDHPTSDEHKLKDGGRYQEFKNGRIYWRTDIGTSYISSSLLDSYDDIGADESRIGYPASDTSKDNGVTYQKFEKGQLYSSEKGAFSVFGSINRKYSSKGSLLSDLGAPLSGEKDFEDKGRYQEFEGGNIYWTPDSSSAIVSDDMLSYFKDNHESLKYPVNDTAKHSNDYIVQSFANGTYYKKDDSIWRIHGGISTKYSSSGGEKGKLGYPKSNEIKTRDGGRYQQFEHGRIYWTSKTKSRIIRNGIGNKYIDFRAEKSYLGYPSSDEIKLKGGGRYQRFENGRIYWSSKTGAQSVHGGIGNRYIRLGAQKSRLGYPRGSEVKSSKSTHQLFQGGRITWSPGKTSVSYN